MDKLNVFMNYIERKITSNLRNTPARFRHVRRIEEERIALQILG